jgi:hypothetical protein
MLDLSSLIFGDISGGSKPPTESFYKQKVPFIYATMVLRDREHKEHVILLFLDDHSRESSCENTGMNFVSSSV